MYTGSVFGIWALLHNALDYGVKRPLQYGTHSILYSIYFFITQQSSELIFSRQVQPPTASPVQNFEALPAAVSGLLSEASA